MGRYLVYPYKEYNSEVAKFNPKAWSEGQATIKNLYNNTIIVKDTVNIEPNYCFFTFRFFILNKF